MSRLAFSIALVALGTALAGACTSPAEPRRSSSAATETVGCLACQEVLVECASTSLDEDDFVACRDQWQACQEAADLDASTCRNPGDGDACRMCQARFHGCTGEGCEVEFGVCKAFLMTRPDLAQACTTTDERAPEVICDVCHQDYAVCASDPAVQIAVCATKLTQCAAASGVDVETCGVAEGEAGCTLCRDQRATCEAAGGEACAEGFARCAEELAPELTCEASSGDGGGGQGGGGSNGGGTSTSCEHDVCEAGVALEATCSPCAADVCASDDFCCTTEWDELCVELAETTPSCGC